MSKIGKLPILIPQGVQVDIKDRSVTVTGPKGTLNLDLPLKIEVKKDEDKVLVDRLSEAKTVKSNHGTIRSILANMIKGVQNPWQKQLHVEGTGYKVSSTPNKIMLTVGFIKPVEIPIPQGIAITIEKDVDITISGIDKTVVGQLASNIRKSKPPEPYKGKGIRYVGEFIKLKAGKTAKTGA